MNRLSYATVLADRRETRYLRTGSGPTVVVLRPEGSNAGRDQLVTALADQFRVIVPEFPVSDGQTLGPSDSWRADDTDLVTWLRGFLDGLGIKEALILVSWQLSWLAAKLRREDPDRVQGIAILLD